MKAVLFVATLLWSTALFAQKDTTRKDTTAPPSHPIPQQPVGTGGGTTKTDTVVIIKAQDTARIAVVYVDGPSQYLRYMEGWRIRDGYFSLSWPERWRGATDHVFFDDYKPFKQRIINSWELPKPVAAVPAKPVKPK